MCAMKTIIKVFREFIVTQNIRISEIFSKRRPILYPTIIRRIKHLLVGNGFKAIEPTLTSNGGCRLLTRTKFHVKIKHGTNEEKRRFACKLQFVSTFLWCTTHILVHPIFKKFIKICNIIVFIMMTEQKYIDAHFFIILIEDICHLTT